MSLPTLNNFQLEILGYIIQNDESGTPVTEKHLYDKYGKHIDFRITYLSMYLVYYQANTSMANNEYQTLVLIGDAKDTYNREVKRVNALSEEADILKKKQSEKADIELELLRKQLKDYGTYKNIAIAGLIVSISSIAIALISLLM